MSCFGGNDGAITISSEGGNGEHEIDWSNGENGQTISDLPAGTYSFTLTDEKECTDVQTIGIGEPDEIQIMLDELVNADQDQSNGSIDVTVDGGVAPYTFNWSNGADTEDLADLEAGDYELEITDANGCVVSSEVFTIESVVSTSQAMEELGFEIYPNPSSGIFHLAFDESQLLTDGKMYLYDVLGHEIKMDNYLDLNAKNLDLRTLESGIYFVKVVVRDRQFTVRLLKL